MSDDHEIDLSGLLRDDRREAEPEVGWREAVDRNRLDSLLGACTLVLDRTIDDVAGGLPALDHGVRNAIRHELETALLALQRADAALRRREIR